MPPLTKEVLTQIATGEMPSPVNFVRFSRIKWDETATPNNRVGKTIEQVIYYDPNFNHQHSEMKWELGDDIVEGKINIPGEDESWEVKDAGQIKRTKKGGISFFDQAPHLNIPMDQLTRRETGVFALTDIAGPDINIHTKSGVSRRP